MGRADRTARLTFSLAVETIRSAESEGSQNRVCMRWWCPSVENRDGWGSLVRGSAKPCQPLPYGASVHRELKGEGCIQVGDWGRAASGGPDGHGVRSLWRSGVHRVGVGAAAATAGAQPECGEAEN